MKKTLLILFMVLLLGCDSEAEYTALEVYKEEGKYHVHMYGINKGFFDNQGFWTKEFITKNGVLQYINLCDVENREDTIKVLEGLE